MAQTLFDHAYFGSEDGGSCLICGHQAEVHVNPVALGVPSTRSTAHDVGSAGINPKDTIGAKRLSLHLVPPAAVIYMALAMTEGGLKYGPYNWRCKKVIATVYVSAAFRHIQKWLDGEECDDVTHIPHLASAMASLGILADAIETGNLEDDRPEAGAASKLFAKAEKEWVPHLRALFSKEKEPK